MLDYHLHLWRHGDEPSGVTLERISAYCRKAIQAGVTELALTEHLFRFVQADSLLAGFWDDDSDADSALREEMAGWWTQERRVDLDDYVEVAQAAKDEGLPVVLGLEVDHYAGRMDKVGALLGQYPFDVLLGAVHWLGAWSFDEDPEDSPLSASEWGARPVEDVWAAYAEAIEEIAASGAVDVLAHPDYLKCCGPTPAVPDEFYDRIAEAAAASGLAAEVSSAAFREELDEPYPAPALLRRFRQRGVPVTTASDAHHLPDVAHRVDELRACVEAAGYRDLVAFRDRRPHAVPLAI